MQLNLMDLSAVEIAQSISNGILSAKSCIQYFLDRINQGKELNAFCALDDRRALVDATEIDQRLVSNVCGEAPLPLLGVPIGIKDVICTGGLRTTAGSRMLANFVPPFDATVVERLKKAGGIIVGKTNTDEFAMGSSTETSCHGVSRNPWDRGCVAGGSSGGAAASVASDQVPVSIGTDTGGSVRQPAAFCGVTGLKPTYGRVSRYGLIAYASSLDQIGPLARRASDCALIMNVIAGHDPRDSTSAPREAEDFGGKLNQSIEGLRIGICREHFEAGLNKEIESSVRKAIQILVDAGAIVVDISLPGSKYAVPSYYVIAPCEASSNLARYDGVRFTERDKTGDARDLVSMYRKTRAEYLGEEVRKRIMLGTYALSSGYYDAYYLQASRVRRLIKQDFDRAFSECDLIVGPTTPAPAFRIGQLAENPMEMYLADIYTVSANLAGIPAISFPVGFTQSGLPIGMQLQGKMFDEQTLLQVAHQYQIRTDWHLQKPPVSPC